MNKSEIVNHLESKGFTLWATLGRNERYQFLATHEGVLPQGINCIINPETEEFEFKFIVPFSVFTLESGRHSPCTNEKHFNSTLEKFIKVVEKVK